MKKLYVIGALALSLLASLVALNKVEAQTATGNLNIEITGGGITCVYDTGHDFGTLQAADVMAAAQTLTGGMGTFSCEDLDGDASWNLTVASDELTNGTASQDMTDITVKADANTVTDGYCTAGTNVTSYTSIYNSAQSILVKSSAAGEICEISADNVTVKVEVPQNQAIGAYQSTFTVTYPA